MNDKYKSIFDNITDEELEDMFKECGFEYTKVEKGQGGLKILDDPKGFFDSLSKDEFSKLLDKYGFEYKEKEEFNCKQCSNYNIDDGIDDIRECQDCNYNNKQ